MPSPRATTIGDLREAIDCLPAHTRRAMLRGVADNEIVVGAYTHDGGICPMLAAHRAGGRTSFIAFARAWDRFTLGGSRRGGPRRATRRELNVLVSHLEASLLAAELPPVPAPAAAREPVVEPEPGTELAAAIRAHRELQSARREREEAQRRRRRATRVRPGDPDRSRELGGREGWAWTPPVRTVRDLERARRLAEEWTVAPIAPAAPRTGRAPAPSFA